MVNLGNEWDNLLEGEFKKEYYLSLRAFLKTEYSQRKIYPDMFDIFNSLKSTSYNEVKVVIIGQDPYHNEGQAHGYAFSVKEGIQTPPSLVNIYKELQDDLGCYIPNNGCLLPWAKQGVLLLNNVLTVRAGFANSHKGKGWENFTTKVIELLNEREKTVVFLLWGNNAKEKCSIITNPNHVVFTAAHPSPLSAYNGFFGCRHFSKANDALVKSGQTPIDWQIPNI